MQVFISYKRDDQKFARQLSATLNFWGYSPCLDVEQIIAGDSWDNAIDRGLQESDVILAVMTVDHTL